MHGIEYEGVFDDVPSLTARRGPYAENISRSSSCVVENGIFPTNRVLAETLAFVGARIQTSGFAERETRFHIPFGLFSPAGLLLSALLGGLEVGLGGI